MSPLALAQEEAARPPDVRLIIDVSGSMKLNDPNNLRQPAVELLVQLLPQGSRAGVWTFGKWVNMLVPHREVDDEWRTAAVAQSNKINSVGLFTNIGGALEKALTDAQVKADAYNTSIILLTDGMVDVEKNPEANTEEWRRIVDQVLPELKAADITVHTVALSDNADRNLMNRLSLATGGLAEVALTADDLMRIFLKAFDLAAPSEQVPLSDNRFLVDSSVEEFTALIFRAEPSEQTQLIGPDEQRYSAAANRDDAKWHRADRYDLVTVKQPLEGEWNVIGKMDPESRITVVSNLNLRVKPLPINVFRGQELGLEMSLQEDGKTITAADFLSLMSVNAAMEAGNDAFSMREFWSVSLSKDAVPSDGVYQSELPIFDKEGRYQLNLIVDGKSFVREFTHQFDVRQSFGAEVQQNFVDGELQYMLTVQAYRSNVDYENTQIVATITAPGDRKKVRPMLLTEQDRWVLDLDPDTEGEYLANVRIQGADLDGKRIDASLETVSFNYSLKAGFVKEKPAFFPPEVGADVELDVQAELPEETNEPEESIAEPTPTPSPNVESEETPENNAALSPLVLYSVLAAGNLLLFVGGFLLFRKLMGGDKDEAMLEEFSDDNIAQPEQTEEENTEEEAEDVELEPPMEDLDLSEDEEEPESDDLGMVMPEPDMPELEEENIAEEEPVADLEQSEMEPELEPEPDLDDMDVEMLAEESPEIPDESEAMISEEDSLMDMEMPDMPPEVDEAEEGLEQEEDDATSTPAPEDELNELDDLEAMIDETEEVEDSEPGEEDMVSAMLKAQGLDLADEELDDAISKLIDELGGDEGLENFDPDEDSN